jgi:hypothetical protein
MLQQLGVRKKVYIGGLIFEPERKAISPVGRSSPGARKFAVRPRGSWVVDFQRCFGRQDELKDFIAVREYFCLEVPFPHGHAVLNNIITAPPSRLSAQFRTFEIWLGGLDSIEEQIRNPTKNGKN